MPTGCCRWRSVVLSVGGVIDGRMGRKRAPGAAPVVYRTARCGLRVTRGQRRRLFGLLRSAGDVWCCVLELNGWRRRRRGLVPVRWYAGRFALQGRVLKIPVANADFRTGGSGQRSGDFVADGASAPPGDGGGGGEVCFAEDG